MESIRIAFLFVFCAKTPQFAENLPNGCIIYKIFTLFLRNHADFIPNTWYNITNFRSKTAARTAKEKENKNRNRKTKRRSKEKRTKKEKKSKSRKKKKRKKEKENPNRCRRRPSRRRT